MDWLRLRIRDELSVVHWIPYKTRGKLNVIHWLAGKMTCQGAQGEMTCGGNQETLTCVGLDEQRPVGNCKIMLGTKRHIESR